MPSTVQEQTSKSAWPTPIATHRDLPQQLATAQRLLAEKNQRLASLRQTTHESIDRISHELRSPLMVVAEFASLLRANQPGSLTSQQEDLLAKIDRRINELILRLDDMLDLGKQQAGLLTACRRTCDVDEILKNVQSRIQRHAAQIGLELITDSADDLPAVFCDAENAERAVVNLIRCAAKASSFSGRVKLTARKNAEDGGVEVGVSVHSSPADWRHLQQSLGQLNAKPGSIRPDDHDLDLGLGVACALVRLNLGSLQGRTEPTGENTLHFALPPDNGRVLLQRFLDDCLDVSSAARCGCLMTATIGRDAQWNFVPVVDDFLQRAMCGTSFVYPTAHRWTIVSLCDESEIGDHIYHVEQQWSAHGRECPVGPLPRIDWKTKGIWRPATQRDELIAAFQQLAKAP